MFPKTPRLSICFVAQRAFGALSGIDIGHAGGVERQQAMMARWLARDGHGVSMVTWDYGQNDGEPIDKVSVYKMCGPGEGWRGLRFLHPRWTSLCKALRRADAEIYFYNLGDMGLGQVAAWCRKNGRRIVYSVSSSPDCDPKLPVLKALRERVLYRYGLRNVDRIVVQTETQRRMLKEGFGLPSTIIPMPCFAAPAEGAVEDGVDFRERASVLWVGRISPEKRVEWVVDIAEACGDLQFDIVGEANSTSAYSRDVIRRATAVRNIVLHGRLPWEEVLRFYDRALCLLCTSAYEGFPNTFLEAWSRGLPVVSSLDPDGVIGHHNLGWVAGTAMGLSEEIKRLAGAPAEWLKASQEARSYCLERHSPESSMRRFEEILQDLAAEAGGNRA